MYVYIGLHRCTCISLARIYCISLKFQIPKSELCKVSHTLYLDTKEISEILPGNIQLTESILLYLNILNEIYAHDVILLFHL
jgi:hypothetical protein